MSDELKKDDRELNFKERILRDLEVLRATIDESTELMQDSVTAQEKSEIQEAVNEQVHAETELTDTTFADEEPMEEGVETVVTTQESAIEHAENSPLEEVSSSDIPQVTDPDVLAFISDFERQNQLSQEEATPPVPDFVAEQAKRLSEMRTQPRVSAVPPGYEPIGADPEAMSPTHKVPLHFSPEDIDLKEVQDEVTVTPLPRRAVDKIEEDLVVPPTPSSSSRRHRRGEGPTRDRQPKKKKKRGGAGRIIAGIFMTLFLLLLATAVALYFFVQNSLGPVDSTANKTVQFEVPAGASVKEIGEKLEKADLIKNALVFEYYAKFNNHSNFQSGYHNLKKSMDMETIIATLQEDGTQAPEVPVLGKVTIPEGYTIKQIAEAITLNSHTSSTTDKTPFTAEEFLETIQDETFIAEMVAKYPDLLGSLPAADSGVFYRLEGYLFPATYEYKKETTIAQLIEEMLAAMDANLRQYYPKIIERGQTVNQVLTLASLVEKEGALDEDRRNIASVFYNRFQANMLLQSNIAILYAEGKLGEKITLSEDASINTQIDSPYNVYVHPGYMPGAVGNPSLSAIAATVEPAETTFLYFVADVTTGKVYFANTFEEHEVNVQTYVNSKVAQGQVNQ